MNIRSLTRGDGAVIGAAVLLLISSFLPFFSFDAGVLGHDKSVNSWSAGLFPILPSVTLGALAAALLLVLHRQQPARQVVGLTLEQWSTAVSVTVGWAALWSAFSTAIPNIADGANNGVSKGAGAWLTLVFGLVLAVAAVMANRLPALKAPLVSAPQPQQQPYGIGAQPQFGMNPQAGAGYGYPNPAATQPVYGTPAPQPPYGGTPAPQPPYGGSAAAPGQDQAAAQAQAQAQAPQAQQQAPAAQAQPSSADFAAFWFAVPVPRPLFAEDGSGGQIAELTPGTWYLAVDQRGQALIAQTQDGRRGVLQDSSGIQRG
ncbi:DUF5336 domain-containing protein [Actinacidiphila yeochonensis]|uniref:DUF5336 domain-containing protein n=1 Tax=Actinacidiphila yeochonensis TaxID=89050 RepID=UPI00056A4A2F|nr:DUF5336 domain-containing protein [Actinacidiphila yeochonensis]